MTPLPHPMLPEDMEWYVRRIPSTHSSYPHATCEGLRFPLDYAPHFRSIDVLVSLRPIIYATGDRSPTDNALKQECEKG